MNPDSNKNMNGVVKSISLAGLLIALPCFAQEDSSKVEGPEPFFISKKVAELGDYIKDFDLSQLSSSFSECDTCDVKRQDKKQDK